MQSEVSCGGGDRVARVNSDHLQDSQRNKIEHKIQQHFAETPFSSRTPLLSKGDFSSSQHFLFPADSSHPKCSAIILRSKLLRRRGPPLFRRATSQPFQFPSLAAFSPHLAAPAFRLSLFLLPSFNKCAFCGALPLASRVPPSPERSGALYHFISVKSFPSFCGSDNSFKKAMHRVQK